MLTFSVFGRKYSFCANLFQKIKIVSLNWNFVTRLIRISKLQKCSIFLFFHLSWNLILRLIGICRIQRLWSLFWFWLEIASLGKFGQNIKIGSLSCNIVIILYKFAEFNGGVHIFFFRPVITFFGELGPKI